MADFFDRIKRYFTGFPVPKAALQLTSRHLCGIHVLPKERKVKTHVQLPLKEGVVEPSFDRPNIRDRAYLEEKVKEVLVKLSPPEGSIALLIPEQCLKMFVFSFESFPPSSGEKERLIRWRIKKQMPLIPENTRLSYSLLPSENSQKVLAAVARESIVREYEQFFEKLKLKVGVVGIPTLNVLSLIDLNKEKDFILSNIEEDYISFMAVTDAQVSLYRFKPFIIYSHPDRPVLQTIDSIVKEVENTVHFIEDREKKKIASLWVRFGALGDAEEIVSELKAHLSVPLRIIEPPALEGLSRMEKQIFSPLVGQIL